MPVVSAIGGKGGIGKSNFIFNAIMFFLDYFEKVKLVDLDVNQKTATKLNLLRKAMGAEPLPFMEEEVTREMLVQMKKDKDTLYLVDVGGFDSDIQRMVTYISDFLITFTSLDSEEIFELKTLVGILEEIEFNTDRAQQAHVLINKFHPSTKDFSEVENAVEKYGKYLKLLENKTAFRADYRASKKNGRVLHELSEYNEARKEFKAVVDEIIEVMNG